MLEATMFTTGYGTDGLQSFTDVLVSDLVVIIPLALGVMATLWGVRLALSYFKGIAR
ncbi:MAG: hypothetical protein RBT49_15685 [Bacteroidales bacterium]|jgi:hypothetical protein|nr:hypothetical protein [Bacteroidales bacterium]